MTVYAIALGDLATGVEWVSQASGYISLGTNRQVYVYLRNADGSQGSEASVFSDTGLSVPMSQPLTAGAQSGALPGFVASGQSLLFVDVLTSDTAQAEALAAADGSGMAVGNPVTGATDISLLATDSSGDLVSGPLSSSVVIDSSPDGAVEVDSEGITDTQVLAYSASEGKMLPADAGSGSGLPSNFTSQASAYTASVGDFVEADATGAGFTVTLPSNPSVGAQVAVKKVDASANIVTVAPQGSGTIDGYTNAEIQAAAAGAGAIFEHAGSNIWFVATVMSATGPQGATGPVGPTGSSGTSAALQAGVYNSGDLAISSISINSSTCALSFTLASAGCYVNSSGGVLTPVSYTGSSYTDTPGTLPASGNYAVVGVEIDTSGNITIVKGTDTATVLNTGRLIASNTPATSSGKMRVADISVSNNAGIYEFGNSTSVASQGVNWIDRRPWARGAFNRIVRNSNASAGNDYTTSSTTVVPIDSVNLAMRIECTGNPIRLGLTGRIISASHKLWPLIDGSSPDGSGTVDAPFSEVGDGLVSPQYVAIPSAGSHLLQWGWCVESSGSLTMYARATIPVTMIVEELMRQNAGNGSA